MSYLSVLASISLPTAPFLVGAVLFVVISLALASWNAQLQTAAQSQQSILLKHSLRPLVIVAFIMVVVVYVFGIITTPNADLTAFFLPVFFAFAIIYITQLGSAIPFWVADEAGLSRQFLLFKKRLPWSEIDWIYGIQNTSGGRARRSSSRVVIAHKLIVEAGARRKIVVVMQTVTSINPKQAMAFQNYVQRNATNALYGINRINAVRERRAVQRVPASSLS